MLVAQELGESHLRAAPIRFVDFVVCRPGIVLFLVLATHRDVGSDVHGRPTGIAIPLLEIIRSAEAEPVARQSVGSGHQSLSHGAGRRLGRFSS